MGNDTATPRTGLSGRPMFFRCGFVRRQASCRRFMIAVRRRGAGVGV